SNSSTAPGANSASIVPLLSKGGRDATNRLDRIFIFAHVASVRLIDLSQPVYADCPICPVHPPVRSELIADHKKSGWMVEQLTLTAHTGSHLDAPLHK